MSFDWDKTRKRQETALPNLDLPDIADKVVIVTGGNTGIGYEIAKYLAANGVAKVILACRNAAKGKAAAASIVHETGCEPTEAEPWLLDLASFASVRAFVQRFKDSGLPLDVLVNNAAMHSVGKQTSEDGLDLLVQVDHISPLLLTLLLLPVLQRPSSEAAHTGPARIVWVTSEGAALPPFPEASLPRPVTALCARSFPTREAEHEVYFTTKLLNIACCIELARLLSGSPGQREVKVAAAHPGLVASELGKKDIEGDNFKPVDLEGRYGMKPRTPADGAKTILVPIVYPSLKVWGRARTQWNSEQAREEGEVVDAGMAIMPVFESMEVMKEYPMKAQDEELRRRIWADSVQLASLRANEIDERFVGFQTI
ncbi:NAD(P)-binding protein [Dentipellis sp. KUC8613]|nr:NAD(P)-binding protein [Dentipellis sp. KUC8613]